MKNELFTLNELDKNTVQIYGIVNGVVRKIYDMGRYIYIYDIRFFKNNNLHKVSNSNIRTLSTLEKLEEQINKIYNETV